MIFRLWIADSITHLVIFGYFVEVSQYLLNESLAQTIIPDFPSIADDFTQTGLKVMYNGAMAKIGELSSSHIISLISNITNPAITNIIYLVYYL